MSIPPRYVWVRKQREMKPSLSVAACNLMFLCFGASRSTRAIVTNKNGDINHAPYFQNDMSARRCCSWVASRTFGPSSSRLNGLSRQVLKRQKADVSALSSRTRHAPFGPEHGRYLVPFVDATSKRHLSSFTQKSLEQSHTWEQEKDQRDICLTDQEKSMHEHIRKIVQAGIQAVDPRVAVQSRLKVGDDNGSLVVLDKDGDIRSRQIVYKATDYDNILIIAFGKASAAMAMKTCEIARNAFPNHPMKGVVIVKDGHTNRDEMKEMEQNYNVETFEASHPIPDERGVQATKLILQQVQEASERTLILCCISGGGSALFCSPRPPLTLNDLADTNVALQKSGMDITKMNVIRKKIEMGKGGGLATAAYPATICSLVLSDIIGDPLDLIASGPTVPDDGCSWEDVQMLIEQYYLEKLGLPDKVMSMIRNGVAGKKEGTPKRNHDIFSTRRSNHCDDDPSSSSDASFLCENVLVGNNEQAVLAAAEEARALGYNPIVLGTSVDGEAQYVGRIYVSMAMQIRRSIEKNLPYQMISTLPVALVVGGETTVTLPADNDGKGGRNQELSLSAALAMKEKGIRNMVLASVGTDGTDGPTDAAGAIVDGGTINRIESSSDMRSYLSNQNTSSLSGLDALRKHDAYHFFEEEFKRYNEKSDGIKFSQKQKALYKPGPTGTNVADIAVVLIS